MDEKFEVLLWIFYYMNISGLKYKFVCYIYKLEIFKRYEVKIINDDILSVC